MKLKGWFKILVAVLIIGTIGINGLAFIHARAMMEFSEAGARTPRPEHLGVLEKVQVLITGITIPRPQNKKTPEEVGLGFETHRYGNRNGDTRHRL